MFICQYNPNTLSFVTCAGRDMMMYNALTGTLERDLRGIIALSNWYVCIFESKIMCFIYLICEMSNGYSFPFFNRYYAFNDHSGLFGREETTHFSWGSCRKCVGIPIIRTYANQNKKLNIFNLFDDLIHVF